MKKKPSPMEGGGGERAHPHRSGVGGGSEFFICFTARPSSSSSSCAAVMRVPSSKSLMSPGHPRDAAAPSLSASLSRRLRSSGSVKGAQSPMFPAGVVAGGRRKGCAFEAAEPSSPKVTCIGQVRVKSKKKHRVKGKAVGAVARSRSQRRSGGEASFRRVAEQEKSGEGEVDGEREGLRDHKNQGWVYQLPVSICEALRAFGSELSCFLPSGGCRPFCSSSSTRDGEEKGNGGIDGEKRTTSSSSCGAVFARWLMAIQESEEGKRREVVGLMVEGRERVDMGLLAERRERRGVDGFEVEEVENGGGMEKKEDMVVAESEMEEARVSVCIPPRNALLLMRCRSDPVRMAALASRVWDSPAVRTQVVEELDADDEEEDYGEKHLVVGRKDCGEDIESDAEETLLETGKSEEKIAEDEESRDELVKDVGLNRTSELNGNEAEEEMRDHDPGDTRKEEMEDEGISSKEDITDPVEALINQSKTAEEEEEEEEEETEEKQLEDLQEKGVQMKGEAKCEMKLPEREPEEEDAETKGRASSSRSSTRQKVDSRSTICFSKAKETAMRRSFSSKEKERRRHSFSSEEARRYSFCAEKEARRASFSVDMEGRRRRRSFSIDEEDMGPDDNKAIVRRDSVIPSTEDEMENKSPKVKEARETVVPDEPNNTQEIQVLANEGAVESGERKGETKGELPDCLLLMMYEPKLSMEVSKETWVCSTDFLRWRPHHPHYRQIHPTNPKPKDDTCENHCSEGKGLRTVEDSTQQPAQPPLSLQPPPAPAPPSAMAIKLKLLNPAEAAPAPQPYGPFVLTRCKSEPMRSSARLAPGACFWKSRHQPIGAIGF